MSIHLDRLQLVAEILEMQDYHVLTAGDSQEALNRYRSNREALALVISEMAMLEMDGKALYRALRKDNPDVKAALFTGRPLTQREKELVEKKRCGVDVPAVYRC